MLTMYDAAVPQSNMPQFDVVAGYIGSPGATPHVWSQADWDSQTPRYRAPIYVPSWWRTGVWNAVSDVNEAWSALQKLGVPAGKVLMIDFETQINAGYVSAFVSGMTARGYYTMLYGSTSSLFLNPPGSMGYWVADPTGRPHLYNHANVSATQYGQVQSGGHDYDLNVIDDQLISLFWDIQGGPVTLQIPPSISQRWPDQAAAFPPNGTYDDATATIWADAGAREAADKANAAVSLLNVVQARLDAMQNTLNQISSQIANMPTGGVSADAIAAAIVTRMGNDLSKG